mgnify:CR=1 FL=1
MGEKPFKVRALHSIQLDFDVWGCAEIVKGGLVAGKVYTFTPTGEFPREAVAESIRRSAKLLQVVDDVAVDVAVEEEPIG